jgi:hypothetical protein
MVNAESAIYRHYCDDRRNVSSRKPHFRGYGRSSGILQALLLAEYLIHYNGHRPHQSRRQRPPDIETQPVWDIADLRSVRQKPVVAGVINEYHHAA